MDDQNELDTITASTDEQATDDGDFSRNEFNRTNGAKPPKNSKNKFLIILIILIVIIGGVFYYVNKTSSNDSKKEDKTSESTTTYTLSKEDEGKISDIVTRITDFYEDSKRTKLKADVDTSKLKPLKKDIESVSDETLKKEFLRLYKQLETDVKNGSTDGSNSLESSSSSLN